MEENLNSNTNKSPGEILFDQISDVSVNILKNPETQKSLSIVCSKLNMDTEAINSLTSMMVIMMTHSAHQSILFYDELLKKELDKQFNNIAHHINLCKADIEGHKGALMIQQKKINDIIEKCKIDDIKKNI